MSITTLLGYWIGRRKAILQIAATPGATWLGLLFVFSAGFAREYDGEDLLVQPWHLFLPLGASLLLSAVLFCLVMPLARWKGATQGTFLENYIVFLRLFWMTAPLAWIYAIPVEHFLSAPNATSANLWILGIVSSWRVLLMARVVSVLFNARLVSAAMPVFLFADTVALIALRLAPLPVFLMMGGIRLSESESIILGTALVVGFFGTASWPIWLIGTGIVGALRKSKWRLEMAGDASRGGVSRGLWLAAAGSILVWTFVLPHTQPEQQLRHEVEAALRHGQVTAAVALISKHQRSDFPPHWDPPPRIGYGETEPPLINILEALASDNASPWVRALFLDKLANQLEGWSPGSLWHTFRPDQLDRCLSVLETLPEGLEIVDAHAQSFRYILDRDDCTDAQLQRVRELLEASGHPVETPDDPPD